jgi:hypothetical protein
MTPYEACQNEYTLEKIEHDQQDSIPYSESWEYWEDDSI